MTRVPLGLLLFGLFLPGVLTAQVIRKVEIVRYPVFAPGELPLGADRLLNSLHVQTVEAVIGVIRAAQPEAVR